MELNGEFDDVGATRMAEAFLENTNIGVAAAAFRSDDKLNVRFSLDSVLDIPESRKQDRHVYKDVTFVRIQVPGDDKNIIYEPLLTEPEVTRNPRHQKNYASRFPKQYAQYIAGEAQADHGTPLSKWPKIAKARVLELSHFGVHTVEQLAAMPDSSVQRGGMGWGALKTQAQDWIATSKDSAHVEKLRLELAGKDEQLAAAQKANSDALAEMKAAMAELREQVAGKVDAKKAK